MKRVELGDELKRVELGVGLLKREELGDELKRAELGVELLNRMELGGCSIHWRKEQWSMGRGQQ